MRVLVTDSGWTWSMDVDVTGVEFRALEVLLGIVGNNGVPGGEFSGSESTISRSEFLSSACVCEKTGRCVGKASLYVGESRSEPSSESAGVKTGGLQMPRVWEKRLPCLEVGEVRNGSVRGFWTCSQL
jgi:hypothetical protein